MCRRSCVYRGGLNGQWGQGDTSCNYAAAMMGTNQQFKTRTKILCLKLGKQEPDEEVKELLKSQNCPFYDPINKRRNHERDHDDAV